MNYSVGTCLNASLLENIEMNTFRFKILLSTYNGEKYIREQIESILSQTYSNFELIIRDDGSTDNTVKIIETFKKDYKKIILHKGNNLGVVKSFLELLKISPCCEEELIAFCDQDDIWKKDKLKNIAESMSRVFDHNSTLYCSRQEYVDPDLCTLGLSKVPSEVGFKNAMVENIAVGCTVAIGKNIREYLLQADPGHMLMHDWWAYLVASSFGEVVFDERAEILYRQHAGSVTAFEPGLIKIRARFKGLIKRMKNKEHEGLQSLNQAAHFINTYENIPGDHKDLVSKLITLREKRQLINRIFYILNPEVKRNNVIENISLKPMILFGWH